MFFVDDQRFDVVFFNYLFVSAPLVSCTLFCQAIPGYSHICKSGVLGPLRFSKTICARVSSISMGCGLRTRKECSDQSVDDCRGRLFQC